jgi:hypothetical protein
MVLRFDYYHKSYSFMRKQNQLLKKLTMNRTKILFGEFEKLNPSGYNIQ